MPASDSRRVLPPFRAPNPIYLTDEHRAWRAAVLRRAGARCEWVEHGMRCTKAAPAHRMFADHRIELRDGGQPFDPRNGQCLCGSHHTLKTAEARAARFKG